MIVASGHMLLNGWGVLDKEERQTRLFASDVLRGWRFLQGNKLSVTDHRQTH